MYSKTITEADRKGLDDSVVDIWQFDLTAAEKDLPRYQNLLDDQETERARRFRSPRAYKNFVLTRGRLKWLLSRYMGVAPEELSLMTGDSGKPRLAETPENQGCVFNVSHSSDLALLAFSCDTALGVDIEIVRERRDLDGLARSCLASKELQRWQECPSPEKLSEFIRLWVCKEAFVKATGQGLSLGLSKIAVLPDYIGFEQLPEPYSPLQSWRLRQWRHDDYRAAVVFSGAEREIRFRR